MKNKQQNILIIDTTEKGARLAGVVNGKEFVTELPNNEKHSENLLVNIEKTLQGLGSNVQGIDRFCAVTGPGSFTGIRIGLSVVKALATAGNKTAVGGTVFNITAPAVKNGVVLLSATADSYYAGEIVNGKVGNCYVMQSNEISQIKQQIYVLHTCDIDVAANRIENYGQLLLNYFTKTANTKTNGVQAFYIQLSQAERNLVNG